MLFSSDVQLKKTSQVTMLYTQFLPQDQV